MKRFATMIGLLFLAGLLAGYLFLGRPSLKSQAQAAYDAKDYPKAYALYKQYAETPAARNDKPEHDQAVMAMVQIQQQMSAQRPAASTPAVAARPATASADLLTQAMSYALQNNGSAGDPPISPASRVPHARPKYGDVLVMSIKEMGNFEFDPAVDADVPADVHLLDGAHVKLSGYMIPLTQAVKVDKFALVPNLAGCCTFESVPGVQHTVTCTVARNQAMDYLLDELEVEGVLHVRVAREDGYTNSIFELDVTGAKIKDLGP